MLTLSGRHAVEKPLRRWIEVQQAVLFVPHQHDIGHVFQHNFTGKGCYIQQAQLAQIPAEEDSRGGKAQRG
jgi:hypothetical protein